MLATLGFLVTAIVLVLTAFTFDDLVAEDSRELRPFGLSLVLVAIAFLMWGLIVLFGEDAWLAHSVLVGDGLIFIASIASAVVATPPMHKKLVVGAGSVIALVLLYVRLKYFFPVPSLYGGILYFNIQHTVAVLLSAIVIIAWLPACLQIARTITTRHQIEQFFPLYVSAYGVFITSAALFLQAKRRSVIIEAFIGFAASVVLLLVTNLLAQQSKIAKRTRHATK